MKYYLLLFIGCTLSCIQPNKYPKAENALDAGREFISALLKDDFKTAAVFMLSNEENKKLLGQYEQKYNKQNAAIKKQYKQAVINIYDVVNVTESETIINYSNSYDNIKHKIKVLKVKDNWLVDIKNSLD